MMNKCYLLSSKSWGRVVRVVVDPSLSEPQPVPHGAQLLVVHGVLQPITTTGLAGFPEKEVLVEKQKLVICKLSR